MNTIVPFKRKVADQKAEIKEELFELVDYLLNLEANSFTGQVKIDFEQGSVNQVAFNQKTDSRYNLSVNE